jgi:hypothetical protein
MVGKGKLLQSGVEAKGVVIDSTIAVSGQGGTVDNYKVAVRASTSTTARFRSSRATCSGTRSGSGVLEPPAPAQGRVPLRERDPASPR